MWRRFCVLLVMGMLLGVGFVVPSEVSAQSTGAGCTCFCRDVGGATKASATKMSSTECAAACEKEKKQVAVCATTLRQYPANNPLCFTNDQCTAQKGELAKYQATDCPAGMTNCFPQFIGDDRLKLNVAIGDLTTVGKLSEYMQAMFKYLIGIAILVCTVMLMVGGFQYAVGAGIPDQVGKAKTKMKNAVIGLGLMMSVVLILQTVNPQLLKMELPRLSLLKPINTVQKTCEEFLDEGYKLSRETGVCGNDAEVVEGPEGALVAEGITCNFTFCDKVDGKVRDKCLQLPDGHSYGKAVCTWCGNVTHEDKQGYGVRPSSSVCRSLSLSGDELAWTTTDGRRFIEQCFYSNDPNVNMSAGDQSALGLATAGTAGFAAVALAPSQLSNLSIGSCAEVYADCSDSELEDCTSYDTEVRIKNNITEDAPEDMFTSGPYVGAVTLKTLCEADPCNLGGHKCVYLEDKDDCVNP